MQETLSQDKLMILSLSEEKMNVICVCNDSASVPWNKRYMGETDATDFSFLNKGEIYFIAGICFVCDRVDYLIFNENLKPSWIPNFLFDLVSNVIPDDWLFVLTKDQKNYEYLDSDYGIQTLIGYPLLVNSIDHFLGILERDVYILNDFEKNIKNFLMI